MIIENPEEKKELDKIPDVDKNGDPIYKIDTEKPNEKLADIGEAADMDDKSEFKDTLQDLKNTTSQD